MEVPFVIAIPSYRRSNSQLSLELFKRAGIPRERIFIFVQTDEDYYEYTRRYEQDAIIVYKVANNVAEARNNALNHILTEYGKNDVLMVDDDIVRLGILENELKEIADDKIEAVIKNCFKIAKQKKVMLFGVYPVYNGFFMEKSISTKTTVNTVLGFTEYNEMRFNPDFVAKEDIDLCGKLLSMNKDIVRFNFIAVDAKHRTNEGGTKEIWKSDIHETFSKKLCISYPKVFARKRSNSKEVRCKLKDKKTPVSDQVIAAFQNIRRQGGKDDRNKKDEIAGH